MNKQERNRNVLLLNIDADRIDGGALRIDLNVVFNPLPVRRGTINQLDYYIASTGAEVTLAVIQGSVAEGTGSVSVPAEYTNSSAPKRNTALKLSPAIKAKTANSEIETSLGEITRSLENERSFTAKFSWEERILQQTLLDDTVKWTLVMPKGEHVIGDFIEGNLYLFASCYWGNNRPRSGRITIRPSNIFFYDNQRRPLGKLKSLVMRYVLWKRDVTIQNSNGFDAEFTETSP